MKLSLLVLLLTMCLLTATCNKEDKIYHSVTGSWRCEEFNPISGISVYLVDIDRMKSDTTQYLLSNFHNQDSNDYIEFIYARLSGNQLVIATQNYVGLIVKSGIGTVSPDFKTIDFEYNIFDGLNEISIKAVYTRPK